MSSVVFPEVHTDVRLYSDRHDKDSTHTRPYQKIADLFGLLMLELCSGIYVFFF